MTAVFLLRAEFPAEPTVLEREDLVAVYLELRKSYLGLMPSFLGKVSSGSVS
jgi:hypothetical protein